MIRLIAKLDIKPPYVVKPVHFDGLRKIGNPIDVANDLYMQGIDEIMYIDIVASLFDSNINYKTINSTAQNLSVPFGVGGGIHGFGDPTKIRFLPKPKEYCTLI